jgi:hypothetical protein
MKAKVKSSTPIEFTISVQDTNFDKAKEWLNKALGFVDINGKVNSTYTIEISIKESVEAP